MSLGKQRQMEKQKQQRRSAKKRRCNVSFNFFFSCLVRPVEAPVLIKLRVHKTALSNGVRIPRLLGFFFTREVFHTGP